MNTHYPVDNLENRYFMKQPKLSPLEKTVLVAGVLIGGVILYAGIKQSEKLVDNWKKLPYSVQQQAIRDHANKDFNY